MANDVPLTPMRRLWRRYLKARGAKVGLLMIAVFVLTAFLAPFIANRLPFYWRDGESGVVTYPLLRDFFAPSDTTELFLEKGLNFLFLFIPAALIAWAALNRLLPGLAKIESKTVSLLFGALVSFVLWHSLGSMLTDGAGGDWLYAETRSLPESDDVVDPPAIAFPPADGAPGRITAREAVLARLIELGAVAAGPDGTDEPAWTEETPEAVAAALRELVTGGPLSPVAALAAAGVDPRGISDQNLNHGLNPERWNRILLEYAYPGLLKPFVEFRTAFVILVAVTVLALLGLTYIVMTAANQFAASPRWLLLLALAFLLALPFRAPPRNDQTPYREMAAQGKGVGVFPAIPYGPNEQGFGPRLPPDWAVATPELAEADLVNADRLARDAFRPDADNPAAVRAGQLLVASLGENGDAADAAALVAAYNRVVGDPALYEPEAFAGIKRDIYLLPYFQALAAGRELTDGDSRRFNRLLLERTFPNTVSPVLASRWKKPQHQRGFHFLGTDESGRDVLTRLLHGARVSLSVGFVSVALATVIGLVMGSLAAYYGGWVDIAISRFMELMMCFPSFFLILAVIAVLDRRSILNIMLIIGLTSWTGVARLIRGEMLKHKRMDYVRASIALGASDARTIFRHILPNAMAPVLVSISFGITGAILTEASLSFIGFGVTPPTPTWGQLLSETRESPLANWWLAVFPGTVLFFGVLAYNLVGEALRDALDPRTTL